MTPVARRALVLGAGVLIAGGLAVGVFLHRVDRTVSREAAPGRLRAERVRPLSFLAVERAAATGDVAGDGRVLGAADVAGTLCLATGSGLDVNGRLHAIFDGLPTLRVSAVASWRGTPVFALERGGWGRLGPAGPEIAATGFGDLEVRTLAETEGGELLLGARQGLFRAPFGSAEVERLDGAPVRSIALLPGGEIAAGGEQGLRVVSRGGSEPRFVGTPDPWVESVAVVGNALWAATAAGAARGPLEGPGLAPVPRGSDAAAGVAWGGAFRFVPPEGPPRVSALLPDGSRTESTAPERFRRLLVAGGALYADGPSGLHRFDAARGFSLVRATPASLPLPHVNALAADGARLWLGFFEGGLASADPRGAPLRATTVPAGDAWGVNALLPMGGVVYAATLRGAFRVGEGDVRALEGAGASFSLAATAAGLAVGYGQGVLLPDRRLLSAFHGLPGNQAYALAASGRRPLGRDAHRPRARRRAARDRAGPPRRGEAPSPLGDGASPASPTVSGSRRTAAASPSAAPATAGPSWESFPGDARPEGERRGAPRPARRPPLRRDAGRRRLVLRPDPIPLLPRRPPAPLARRLRPRGLSERVARAPLRRDVARASSASPSPRFRRHDETSRPPPRPALLVPGARADRPPRADVDRAPRPARPVAPRDDGRRRRRARLSRA